MKVNLNLNERVLLEGILPHTGNVATLLELRPLVEAVTLNKTEEKVLGLDKTRKEIEVPEAVLAVIVSRLKGLNKAKTLTIPLLGLYDLFVTQPELAAAEPEAQPEQPEPTEAEAVARAEADDPLAQTRACE